MGNPDTGFPSGTGTSSQLTVYLIGFWRFVLSGKFRRSVFAEWHDRGRMGKLLIPVEVAISICCGLAPFLLLYLVLFM